MSEFNSKMTEHIGLKTLMEVIHNYNNMKTITAEEFKKKYGDSSNVVQPPQSFLQDAGQDLSQIGSDVKTSFQTGIDKMKQASDRGFSGEQSFKRTFDQQMGIGLGTVSSIFGDVFKGVVKAVLPQSWETGIKSGASAVINPVMETQIAKSVIQKYNSLDAKTKADIDSALGTTQFALDVATLGAGKQAGQIAVEQGLKTGGRVLETGLSATEQAGKIVKAGGKEVFETGIGLSAKEAPLMVAYRAKVPFWKRVETAIFGGSTKPVTNADTAFRNILGGTEGMVAVQAKKAKTAIWDNVIAPALKESKEVLTKDELFNPIISRISKITDPIKKQAYEDAFNYIKDVYKNEIRWTLDSAQNLKVDLTELLPEAVWKGKPIANTLKQLKKDMSGAIRNKINNSLKDVNAKQAYFDYGNLKNLEEWGTKSLTGSKLKGGFGGFWSGIKDMAVTPVATIGGKIIYKVGEGLEFVGERGAKTLKDLFKN